MNNQSKIRAVIEIYVFHKILKTLIELMLVFLRSELRKKTKKQASIDEIIKAFL